MTDQNRNDDTPTPPAGQDSKMPSVHPYGERPPAKVGKRRCWKVQQWLTASPGERGEFINRWVGKGWKVHSIDENRVVLFWDVPATQATFASKGRTLFERTKNTYTVAAELINDGYDFGPNWAGDHRALNGIIARQMLDYLEALPEPTGDMADVIEVQAKTYGVVKTHVNDPLILRDNIDWLRKTLQAIIRYSPYIKSE